MLHARWALLLAPAVAQLVLQDGVLHEKDLPAEQAKTELTLEVSTPKLCDDVVQYSGYLKGSAKPLFFWFFESRNAPEQDPTLLWLTGGPGCSSQMALLVENGPCKVGKDGKTTTKNDHSWNNRANALWVDQPAGSGFSGGKWDSDSTAAAEDMYSFLQTFFAKFPKYNRDFYVFGESYAGHYVPATAHRIFTGNQALKEGDARRIDLKGFAIGNGLTHPEVQYKYYPDMIYQSGTAPAVVPKLVYDAMSAAIPVCTSLIRWCNEATNTPMRWVACKSAFMTCNMAVMMPYKATLRNPYDMRIACEKQPLCYDFGGVDAFLNRKEVQEELGVKGHWASCNMAVNLWFQNDWMHSYAGLIPEMIEGGVRALIYAGDQDYVCNWLGNKAWVEQLQWAHGDAFKNAQDVEWRDAGKLRKAGNLAFLQIYKAGHMVPLDQPKAAHDMVLDFLSDSLKDTTRNAAEILV